MYKKALTFAVASTMLISASTSFAQQQSEQQQYRPPIKQEKPSLKVSDQQMKEFIDVYGKIASISQTYQQKLAKVKTQEESNAIMNQANAKMVKEVEKSDLDIQEYNQILTELQTNKNLQEQFQKMAK